jgi:hypothetical protein
MNIKAILKFSAALDKPLGSLSPKYSRDWKRISIPGQEFATKRENEYNINGKVFG